MRHHETTRGPHTLAGTLLPTGERALHGRWETHGKPPGSPVTPLHSQLPGQSACTSTPRQDRGSRVRPPPWPMTSPPSWAHLKYTGLCVLKREITRCDSGLFTTTVNRVAAPCPDPVSRPRRLFPGSRVMQPWADHGNARLHQLSPENPTYPQKPRSNRGFRPRSRFLRGNSFPARHARPARLSLRFGTPARRARMFAIRGQSRGDWRISFAEMVNETPKIPNQTGGYPVHFPRFRCGGPEGPVIDARPGLRPGARASGGRLGSTPGATRGRSCGKEKATPLRAWVAFWCPRWDSNPHDIATGGF